MITEYENICLICGKLASEKHHLVYGRGIRPIADKDGLLAPLCARCHKFIHEEPGAGVMSKIIGQIYWEMDYIGGQLTPDDATLKNERAAARDNFRIRYGRSWL